MMSIDLDELFAEVRGNFSQIDSAWGSLDRSKQIRALILLTRATASVIDMFPEESEPSGENNV